MKVLRPHQIRGEEMLRESGRRGKKRPVLDLPPGSGKTRLAAELFKKARAKGKRCLFVVDAVELIDQTVNALFEEGLHDIGVVQADHPLTDYSKPIQVASIQTLARRKCPEFDLCINDECHILYDAHIKIMQDNPSKMIIGMSATPWTKGLGNYYDDLVKPATVGELTDQNYVAKLQAYAPSHPDLAGVKIKAGEYDETQLSQVMQGEKLIADVVETWKRLGQNRPTLAFCVDRNHARAVQERFQAEWIQCGYIDGTMHRNERKEVRRQLDAGEIKIVVSVGTMIKGVDWKFGTIVDAQPTRSHMRHVQKYYRLRPFAEWDNTGIVLDHSDNILRLGLPIDIHRDTLCTKKKGEKSDGKGEAENSGGEPATCKKCTALIKPGDKSCYVCGFERKPQGADIEEGAGSLSLVGGDTVGPKKDKYTPEFKRQFLAELYGWAQAAGKNDAQVAGKYKAKMGEWPDRGIRPLPAKPSPETLNFIRSQNIRYAMSNGRKRA